MADGLKVKTREKEGAKDPEKREPRKRTAGWMSGPRGRERSETPTLAVGSVTGLP